MKESSGVRNVEMRVGPRLREERKKKKEARKMKIERGKRDADEF